MSEKSAQKRKFIVETARGVFARKGFEAVTMKDIVEACGISRGGLYLYFPGTKELFEEVLRSATEDDDDEAIGLALKNDASAADMLALFIKEQKKSVFRKKDNLTFAAYEFYVKYPADAKVNPLRQQFDTAVRIVQRLIETGVEAGDFYCEDPLGCARNLMYTIEGLRISSHTMGIREEMFDREVLYILQGLVAEEE